MKINGQMAAWAESISNDTKKREKMYKIAHFKEICFALGAAFFAIVAIWGFTSESLVLNAFKSSMIGGISVLCFSVCMAISAGGTIEKRFLALAIQLQHKD